MIPHIFCILMVMVTAAFCAPGQDSNVENTLELARENKPKPRPSSSGTLDPLGGGHLLRIIDPEEESELFQSLNSVHSHQDTFGDDLTEQVRESKATPRPSSSGTLDSIGGGNLLRADDFDAGGQIFRSLVDSSINYQSGFHENMLQERENKPSPRPSSSGTLDPLGGGNFVRATDVDTEGQIFRSLGNSLINYEGRQNMLRLVREDKSIQRPSHLLGVIDPYRDGHIFRSLDHGHLMESLDNYQGGEVLRMLDAITGSDLLSSLDTAEGMAVLSALKKTHTKHPKRMLDSVSGWAFGESKRSTGESKRNFDEIDNVGFTSFAKKSPSPYYRKQYESLAKKNFDEIDRTGFDTYNKRNFDEIDRTGFETFEKRDRKE